MPKFPSKENDVSTLAMNILSGLTAHPTDFPNVDGAAVSAALNEYTTSRTGQMDVQSQAVLATEAKETKLAALEQAMKAALRQAEIDQLDTPEKLTEIGWGPRSQPSALTAPGEPLQFRALDEGPGDVIFTWKKPVYGGAVRSYLLQRRQQLSPGVEFGPWQQAGVSFAGDIQVTGQPRGVQLEYRVIASNPAGESLPSNVVAMVL